mgnify:CR=1 FL=1
MYVFTEIGRYYARVTVNLSNSIIKFFCCLKGNGRPRSSSLGPIKIRTVPLCGVLLRLLTRIVYVNSAWFRWVNLASTAPRGVKSSPRDKSTSLLLQNVFRTFCCWLVATLISAISTPGKSNYKKNDSILFSTMKEIFYFVPVARYTEAACFCVPGKCRRRTRAICKRSDPSWQSPNHP